MVTSKYIEDNLSRTEMAESVGLPSELWREVLLELQSLRNFAIEVNELFECREGQLHATGACNKKAQNIWTKASKIATDIKYEEVPNDQ